MEGCSCLFFETNEFYVDNCFCEVTQETFCKKGNDIIGKHLVLGIIMKVNSVQYSNERSIHPNKGKHRKICWEVQFWKIVLGTHNKTIII